MHSQSINTLSEFLLQAGTEYFVYDMGRAIVPINTQTFLEIENNSAVPSRPRAGFAWFGIVFWNKQLNHEHYIWFVKLPIDEKGLISSAARNQFLEIVVTALGKQLEHAQERQAELPENPFVFTPSQQQMADFNAVLKTRLGLPFNATLSLVAQYVSAPSVRDWRTLALQDISNFAAQLYLDGHSEKALIANLHNFAPEFLTALFSSFENMSLRPAMISSLITFFSNADGSSIKAMALRALGHHTMHPECIKLLSDILKQDDTHIDILIVIAGRHWEYLSTSNALLVYMQSVAKNDTSFALFKGIYADLVQLPSVRSSMLDMIRQADKPTELTQAIGSLFSDYSTNGGIAS